MKLLDKHRRNDGNWDVIVPSSGGKDSAFVAHQLKYKYGMTPLTVTWTPLIYTDIGYQNFQNFRDAGFTNLLCSPNGNLHRKLARLSFEELGDAFHVFVLGQLSYAFHIALNFGVSLVFLEKMVKQSMLVIHKLQIELISHLLYGQINILRVQHSAN